MTFPTITPLPAAPNRGQAPEDFSNTADAFVAALPDLVTEVNSAGSYIDQKIVSVGNAFQGTYSAGTTYTTGQSVIYNGLFYLSLVNANTGNTPSSSPSQWVQIAGEASQVGFLSFTASGTIAAGDPVSVKNNGQAVKTQAVSVQTSNTLSITDSASNTAIIRKVPNTNNFIIFYRNSTTSLNAVVVQYNGSALTFGTPVAFRSVSGTLFDVAYDTSQSVFVVLYNNTTGTDVEAIACSVSGTTITFGTQVTVSASSSTSANLVYHAQQQRCVATYITGTDPNFSAVTSVLVASGTTLTHTAGATIFGPTTSIVIRNIAYHTTAEAIFTSFTVGGTPRAYALTLSGTTVTVGALTSGIGSANPTGGTSCYYEPNLQRIIYAHAYSSGAVLSEIYSINISGTTITSTKIYESATETFLPSYVESQSVNVGATSSKFYDLRLTTSSGVAKVSNLPATIGTLEEVAQSPNDYSQVVAISVASNLITVRAVNVTDGLYNSFVGIADASVTNGQTVRVASFGALTDKLSGLLTAFDYYLNASGQISTTGEVLIGRATTTNRLLIKG